MVKVGLEWFEWVSLIGLSWVCRVGFGLGCFGLGWLGLLWLGLDWLGFDLTGMDRVGLGCFLLDWVGLHWGGLDWDGMEFDALPYTMGKNNDRLPKSQSVSM